MNQVKESDWDRNWCQEWDISVIGLTMPFVKGILWNFGLEMIEYFKQRLLGHPSRGMEDAESNINYDDLAQEISKGKNISK